MSRTRLLLAAFVLALTGNQIASAKPPANPSDSITLSCLDLPPLWHGVLCLIGEGYEQTIAICDEVLRGNPNHQAAYVVRAYAHLFKRNEDPQAIADLTEALRRGPDNAALHVARAKVYERAKDYDRAIADCTEAIRIDPDSGQAYAWRAACYLDKRVTNKAIADYTIALRHAPYLAWARRLRAEAYRRRGESARALADLEEVLREDPNDELARFTRCGVYLYNLHDCDRVIAETSELILLYPRVATWYSVRSMAYLVKGETTKGLGDWAAAVALKPDYLHLHFYCKNQSLRLGFNFGASARSPWEDDPDERIAACTKRLEQEPNNVAAYYERASAYISKRDAKHAAADLSDIIRLDPSDAEAFRSRGCVLGHLGSYTDALDDFAKAIRLDPGYVGNYTGRARAYFAMGKYEDALQDCAEILRIDPRCTLPHSLRGWVHRVRKQYDLAIADYSEAIRLAPAHADYYQRRAEARGFRDFAGIIADYKEAVKLDPSNVHACARLAACLSCCPDASLRDGKEARRLATIACKATSWRDSESLSSLAWACAECDDFDAAVKWETKAIELAPNADKKYYQERLELFRAHKPYHATPPKGVSVLHSSK